MDLAIVSLIFEAGSDGILAKSIMEKLKTYNLEQHKIKRVVNRVNQNIQHAFGESIIEKRGKKWAFTSFGVEIWGKVREDEITRNSQGWGEDDA